MSEWFLPLGVARAQYWVRAWSVPKSDMRRVDQYEKRRMAGTFNYTFKVPGETSQGPLSVTSGQGTSVVGSPTAVPVLEPFDLFPTRIWQAHMPGLAPHLQEWVTTVLAMRAASPQPAGRTNRLGWNSQDMAVLDRPVFAPLQQAIRAACAGALQEMGVRDVRFRLQSWINLHDRGGFNFLHVHEGSLLSGSFYLQVPQGSGKFVFRDPRPGVVHGYVKGAVANGYSDVHLAPDAGLLVLFPCWMEHFVEPHNSDEPRITIAFNALEDRGDATRSQK
jgi:uncharacterized protein (TIGR02466 family)